MRFELILTPTGRLRLQQEDDNSGDTPETWMKRAVAALGSSQAEGLFALGATRLQEPLSPSFTFWRDFACRYLTRLCRTLESAGHRIDPIAASVEAELAVLLLSVPLMQGAEYL